MYWNKTSPVVYGSIEQININMRCIEIILLSPPITGRSGLTLTWDVLKFITPKFLCTTKLRLTLTWDVLKLQYWYHYAEDCKININMRCIEMLALDSV